jgi:hypothetical protein
MKFKPFVLLLAVIAAVWGGQAVSCLVRLTRPQNSVLRRLQINFGARKNALFRNALL